MKVTSKRINIDSTWFSPEREIERNKGLHLSHVIDYIEEQEGVKRDGNKKALHNYACAGFLWERVLDRFIHGNPEELWEWLFTQALFEIDKPEVVRPGEQVITWDCPDCACLGSVNGALCRTCKGLGVLSLYMTPDGFHISDNLLEEWKYTSKSVNTPITANKFRRWVAFQIPAYLKALFLTACRLRVYHSRGDYTTGEPHWIEHILEYTQQEIDETWDCIRINAEIMYRKGYIS